MMVLKSRRCWQIPTENNKLITPKLTLEVIPSSLNSLTPTEEIASGLRRSDSQAALCLQGRPCFHHY